MSASHGCNNGMDVVEKFTEALKQRIGEDRFGVWFETVSFEFLPSHGDNDKNVGLTEAELHVTVRGQFALDRIGKNFLPQLRGAASQACGKSAKVVLRVAPARQVELPLEPTCDALDDREPDDREPNAAGSSERDQSNEDMQLGRGQSSPNRKHANKSRPKSSRPKSSRPKANHKKRSGASSISSILQDGVSNRNKNPQRARRTASPQTSVGTESSGTENAQVSQQPLLPELAKESTSTNSNGASKSDDRAQKAGAHLANPVTTGASSAGVPPQAADGESAIPQRWETFVLGPCNQLAHTACRMVCESPSLAAPLFLWGPTGTGKTHLLHALARQLRRGHRFRRVVTLSAESFTNDFITSVTNSGLPAFRSRYRDVDALLIDDIQFIGGKKSTLRELLYTVETLSESGRAIVFAGSHAPGETEGLSVELAGRMAGGMVCQIQGLDFATRRSLLANYTTQQCPIECPGETLDEIASLIAGDGRVVQGVVNLVSLLQRMQNRMPTMDEIRQFGGHLLRASEQPVTLSAIERAVEQVFQLPSESLQTPSRTKTITEPRMLAMYLSRELTSSAFGEIGRHYGGRSHSTAIMANQRVTQWLEKGESVGRGQAALSVQEALQRIETLLRTG